MLDGINDIESLRYSYPQTHPPIRYGPSLYLIFPSCAPLAGTAELSEVQRILPQIEAGEGRSVIACKSP